MNEEEKLRAVMKFHLQNLSGSNAVIDDHTIHNTVLSDNDGPGWATSKNVYKAFIRWTLQRNNYPDKPWPADWFSNSVSYLASKLLSR